MPRPALRSRKMRRKKKKTPGGRYTTHYAKLKPKTAKCAVTGDKLSGVPKKSPYQMRKLPKTKKRPERPFGGYLSPRALKEAIKAVIHSR